MSDESVFRAIAHPIRRQVLEILRAGERPAAELVQDRRLTHPTLSVHLRVLRATGLVTFRRRGTSLIYRLNRAALQSATTWMSHLQRQG